MRNPTFRQLCIYCFFAICASVSAAQSIKQKLWVTDGEVRAIVKSGRLSYIAGDFSYVGPNTGGGAVLGFTTGLILPSSPQIEGDVLTIVGDGNNGWYIGGNFTRVNGLIRSNAARILADGSVDNTWNPQFDGPVHTLSLGTAGVYAGGSFTRIGVVIRNNAALLNPTNAAVLEWNPNPNAAVRTISVVPPFAYVGGEFTAIGAVPFSRSYVARTDLTTGGVDTIWSPAANAPVLSIFTAAGQNNVWLAGNFTQIDTASRPFLASVTSGGEGFVTDWNPRPNGPVHVMKFAGSRLHIAGGFSTVGDSLRNNAAAVDPFAGRLLPWNPNVNGPINAMESLGGIFFIGGRFSTVGTAQRRNAAAVDSIFGTPLGWNPTSGSEVKTIGVQTNVFMGGLFRSVNGVLRNNFAAVDDTAGATSFSPNTNGTIHSLRLSGGTLYLGGEFDTVGGQRIPRLAAVSTTSGFPTVWRPQVGTDGIVYAIEKSQNTIYAGGTFTLVGTTQRRYLAAFDSASGSLLSWNPDPNDHVLALTISGGTMYTAGRFTQIGNEVRNRVGAINVATGVPTSWDPNTTGVTEVQALTVAGPVVYIGGAFNQIGGQTRNSLAALDLVRGDVTDFNAGLPSQSIVQTLLAFGNSVYVGGVLNSTSDLISANRVTGAVNPWNPQIVGGVSAIAVSAPDTCVFAGGRFTRAMSESRHSFAGFIDQSVLLPAFVMNRTSVGFGTVPLGGAKDDTVFVSNTGGGVLTVADVVSNNPAFTVLLPSPLPIQFPPGQTRTFVLRFLPVVGGAQSGVITFTHNAQGSPTALPVTGTGFGPLFVPSRLSMEFGSIRVNQSRYDTISVGNSGNDTLKISFTSVTDTQFTVSPAIADILPSASRVFTISFRPRSRGQVGGLLRFSHNAPGSPSSIALSGSGVASELQPVPQLLLFDSVAVGSSRTLQAGFVNIGDADLHVSNIHITGPNAGEFAVVGSTGPYPAITPFVDTLRVPIRFSPVTLQANKSASLVVQSDALTASDTVMLQGSGRNTLIQVTLGGDTSLGSQINVTAQGPAGFVIVRATLYFRSAGQLNYDSLEMSVSGQAYTGTFPGSAVTPRGIEYFVRLTGVEESITNPELDPENNPAIVRVRVGVLASPQQLTPRKYRMISVPLELNETNVGDQLIDNFGPYNQSRWRLFRWENERNVEFPSIQQNFLPGNSFWLITSDGTRFDAKDGRSVLSGIPFNIRLVPGWNQIASPFAFPVDWEGIENSNLVQPPVFWNGDEYNPDVQILDPWEGYFVLNDSSQLITLSVPPIESVVERPKQLRPFPLKSDKDYVLQLSGVSGTMKDTYNYLGFVKDATAEYDRSDIVEPPQIGEHLSLSISDGGKSYLANFKPVNAEGQQWRVAISATVPDVTVRVSVREMGMLPRDFAVYVFDEDEFACVPLPDGSFSLRLGNANSARSLRIVIGTAAFARLASGGIPLEPVAYALGQNYPNPFNPSTTIRYSLNKRGDVSLSIYNLLGQKVRTLVSAVQATGTYAVLWDGSTDAGIQASSGVYVYVLRAGEFYASRKLLLLR